MRRALTGMAAGAALVVTGPVLAGCGGETDANAESGKVTVVASTNVYGDIVRRIGGDRVTVTSFISDPAQDPHSYQASTKNQLALSRAKVVVENGGGYDDFIDKMLSTANNGSATVINAVKVAHEPVPSGGERGGTSRERPASGGEHVWYDFTAMDRLAKKIASALGAADKTGSDTYTANARAFGGDLAALEKRTDEIKKKHTGEGVAITEPVPGYLLDAAGLRDRTPEEFSEAIEEGDDVPPRALKETLGLFSGPRKVRALVYNAQTSGPQTKRVVRAAKDGGVPAVPVTETLPSGKTYVGWMRANVGALATALSGDDAGEDGRS